MMAGLERAKEDWYPVAIAGSMLDGEVKRTKLLGIDICLIGGADSDIGVTADDLELSVQTRFGHIWTTFSDAPRSLFDIPEADEPGRVLVPCGVVRVKCSPLRAVENFLDIAHFPFVHTDILGAEPHTEVEPYDVKIDESKDEVIATKVKFFQPQAAKSAGEGIVTDYVYRVAAPMVSILYKTCSPKPDAQDVITLFVQPLDEDTCNVWPWMALYDYENSMAEMISFQQMIFVQDRSILENQKPRRLPLDPKMEIPTRADMTSIAYRRWLKRGGAIYGALTEVV